MLARSAKREKAARGRRPGSCLPWGATPGRDHLFAVDADSSHSILVDGLLEDVPRANGELRMLGDDASSPPTGRRLRRAAADTVIADAPIAAAMAWAS